MPTISRLATIAPEIDDALLRLPSEKRNSVALAAARWAVSRALPSDSQVVEWLEVRSRIDLEALASQLDERYLELAEAVDSQSDSQVAKAFSEARAVRAAAFAVKGEAQDAVYEAAQSTDQLHDFRQFVLANAHAV